MEWTETPDGIDDGGEDSPDFDDWDAPNAVLKGAPTRERLLDVVLQLRDPTKVSTIADRAGCDTETAREYLEWFASMGIAREHPGRPVQYERNDSYLRWRRIERIRDQYSEPEIVDELRTVTDAIEEFRERFDAETPADVSLFDASDGAAVEATWEALSEWKTLVRRAELLDAARRSDGSSSGRVGRIDA